MLRIHVSFMKASFISALCIDWNGSEHGVAVEIKCLLEKVRIFFNSVRKRISKFVSFVKLEVIGGDEVK